MSGTILYIEDNETNMRLVRRMLSASDYHLIEAYTGSSGIDIAIHARPDLILMDISLPDMSGLDATRHLKAHRELAYTPIIALTSHDRSRDRQDALNAGCSGYLTKPISRTNLLWTINAHLNEERLSRADIIRHEAYQSYQNTR